MPCLVDWLTRAGLVSAPVASRACSLKQMVSCSPTPCAIQSRTTQTTQATRTTVSSDSSQSAGVHQLREAFSNALTPHTF
jgi:hypothetical protein